MKRVTFKVIKNGNIWDYTTHYSDTLLWRDKILREEPDADVTIEEASYTEMMDWKSY